MTRFKVTYPLITQDGSRIFDNKEEAEKFAAKKRKQGPYDTIHSWRHVKVEEIKEVEA